MLTRKIITALLLLASAMTLTTTSAFANAPGGGRRPVIAGEMHAGQLVIGSRLISALLKTRPLG